MTSHLNPHLSFDGTARQAMEFYADVFGGELAVNTFGDFGVGEPSDADRIMHAHLETDAGYTIMASDVPCGYDYQPVAGIAVAISGDDADRLRGYWDKLSAEATITMPLAKQIWCADFGMCVDKFGVAWMVNISAPE